MLICWKSRHKPSRGLHLTCLEWNLTSLCLYQLWLLTLVSNIRSYELAAGINTVVQKDAEFDFTYNDEVKTDNQTIYAFNHTVSRNKVWEWHSRYWNQAMSSASTCLHRVFILLFFVLFLFFFSQTEGVRVWVNLLSESPKNPILFVVRQKQAVLSFQVPLILRGLWVTDLLWICINCVTLLLNAWNTYNILLKIFGSVLEIKVCSVVVNFPSTYYQ